MRIDYKQFNFRFRALLGAAKSVPSNEKDLTKAIMVVLGDEAKDGYQLGHTKLFLREATERSLEEGRGDPRRN